MGLYELFESSASSNYVDRKVTELTESLRVRSIFKLNMTYERNCQVHTEKVKIL